jgi:pimeloyl-ACP methyl ester carboxylesterase
MEGITARTEVLTDEFLDEQITLASQPGVRHMRQSTDAYQFDDLTQDPNQMQLFDLRYRLPNITVPTAIVWGQDDDFAPLYIGHALRELLPRADYFEVAGARHHLFHDQPDTVNELMLRFFSR